MARIIYIYMYVYMYIHICVVLTETCIYAYKHAIPCGCVAVVLGFCESLRPAGGSCRSLRDWKPVLSVVPPLLVSCTELLGPVMVQWAMEHVVRRLFVARVPKECSVFAPFISVYMHIYMYAYIHINVYIYIYVYVYCIYIYTCIQIDM